jgi:hypothetical protein
MQMSPQPRRELVRRRRAVRLDPLDDGQRGGRPAADHDLDRVRQPVEDRAPFRSRASSGLGAGRVQIGRRYAVEHPRLEPSPDRHVHHAVGDLQPRQVLLFGQTERRGAPILPPHAQERE